MIPSRTSLALFALLVLAAPALLAQAPLIETVRIGLPTGQAGQEAGCTRNGAWAPVAIKLRGSKEGNAQGAYRLRIETTDLEDVAYQTSVAVPALSADNLRTVTGYIVPGGIGATFRIHVETLEGKVVRTTAIGSRDTGLEVVVGNEDVLFFGIGSGLSQLKRSGEKLDQPEGKEPRDPEAGRRQFAFADEVTLLPDRWTGYDAVDVVVLATGKRDFVLSLAQDSESARRNALLEWVRRGGQLVLSVGRNKQEVAPLLERMPLLDCKITGSEVVRSLSTISTHWAGRGLHQSALQQVEVATLAPGPRVDVLVREGSKPILVQSAFGLGRVILVAFDLDAPPFSTWDGQEAFWTRLQNEVAPYLPVRGQGKANVVIAPQGGVPVRMGQEARSDIRSRLKRDLEQFEETPTISFGWVALFILFYILLVGPLDYLILKKVFKRLELTWVTFPLTVLLVSVLAYATAYTLKGDELRINKVDLIDIDLNDPGQVYGSSWFTLLSPRVASYTIGIEPASDSWTAPIPATAPGPILTLLESGDRTFRTGTQGLYRRPYTYADEAVGLDRVPIPVWATRSFTAQWRAPLRKTLPIGYHDDVGPLRVARDGGGLVGRLTNNLPVRLQDAALIYRNQWYSLGNLEPGESKRTEPLFAADAQGQKRDLTEWFGGTSLQPGLPLAPSGRRINANFQQDRSVWRLMKALEFFTAARNRQFQSNAGVRRFDQSWRLEEVKEYPTPERRRYRDEVVLVARAPMLCDHAEEVTRHPVSPSRLWLGQLPQADTERPVVPGTITQETYVRVFLPVQR